MGGGGGGAWGAGAGPPAAVPGVCGVDDGVAGARVPALGLRACDRRRAVEGAFFVAVDDPGCGGGWISGGVASRRLLREDGGGCGTWLSSVCLQGLEGQPCRGFARVVVGLGDRVVLLGCVCCLVLGVADLVLWVAPSCRLFCPCSAVYRPRALQVQT